MPGRPVYYRLDDAGNAVPTDGLEGGKLLAGFAGRALACERTRNGYVVSTAFLVFDHRGLGDGPPVLWDTHLTDPAGRTVIVGRYATMDEAAEGHRQVVAWASLLG